MPIYSHTLIQYFRLDIRSQNEPPFCGQLVWLWEAACIPPRHFRAFLECLYDGAGFSSADALMAAFRTPDRAVAAALRMREAMGDLI
jgi:hypothetical protein